MTEENWFINAWTNGDALEEGGRGGACVAAANLYGLTRRK